MKRILVIDDETWLREMVHMALEQKGFEVLEAENGDKALAGKMLGISRATLYRKLKRYNIGLREQPNSATLQ